MTGKKFKNRKNIKNILNILKFTLLTFFIIFNLSCDDFTDPNPTLAAGILPTGKITINSADLYWTEYEGDDFSRYEIYFTKTSNKDFNLYSTINSKNQVFTTVTGLEPDTYYNFYIRVVNKNGLYSDSKEYQIKTLDDQPSAPKIYYIEVISYNSVKLRFSEYKEANAVKFWKYELHYSTNPLFVPSSSTLIDSLLISKDTTRMVYALKEWTTYHFKVRTYNAIGKFAESSLATYTTGNKPPDTSFLYQPTEITDTTAKINWTKYKDNDFKYYEVHLDTKPNFSLMFGAQYARIVSSGQTSYLLTKLKPNQEYFVKIVSFDQHNAYSISNEEDFCARPGGGPVPVSFVPDDILAGQNWVFLTWTSPKTKIFDSYELHKSKTQNFTPNGWETSIWVETNPEITIKKVENLERNTTYYFKMVIRTKTGRSSTSDEISIKTLP